MSFEQMWAECERLQAENDALKARLRAAPAVPPEYERAVEALREAGGQLFLALAYGHAPEEGDRRSEGCDVCAAMTAWEGALAAVDAARGKR